MTMDAFRRWLAALGAVDVLDWRLVEQPSDQYPAGRWEALVERADGAETWVLAPLIWGRFTLEFQWGCGHYTREGWAELQAREVKAVRKAPEETP